MPNKQLNDSVSVEEAGVRSVWLLQDGEPLPTDPVPQVMRTARLAQALNRLGITVTWFASLFDHGRKIHRPRNPTILPWGERTKIVLLDGPGYQRNISAARIWHQMVTARNFLRVTSGMDRPQLILGSYPSPELCWQGARQAARFGCPFVIDVRDAWPDVALNKKSIFLEVAAVPVVLLYNRLLRYCLHTSTSIVSVSEQMLAWALQKAGRSRLSRDQVFYLGYGGAPQDAPSDSSTPGTFTEKAPLRCIYFGMFGSCHDGLTAIQAVRRLRESGERRLELVFVGDGEFRAAWEEAATGLECVRFLGWLGRDAAQEVLRSCQVGIIGISGALNSIWVGNKFFEYVGNGLAVISDVQSELKELIQTQRIGTTTPPGDVDATAAALRNYLEDPQLLRETRMRAWQAFQSLWADGVVYDRYAQHLAGLAQRDPLAI